MKVADCLCLGAIQIPLAGKTKEEVIGELAGLLAAAGKVADARSLVEAVLKREQVISTAIGEGVCIPHAKLEGIAAPCAAFGVCPEGIACQTPDQKPVKFIFVIAADPKDAAEQLKLLACLARCLKAPGIIAQLESAPSPQDVLNIFNKIEEVVRL